MVSRLTLSIRAMARFDRPSDKAAVIRASLSGDTPFVVWLRRPRVATRFAPEELLSRAIVALTNNGCRFATMWTAIPYGNHSASLSATCTQV